MTKNEIDDAIEKFMHPTVYTGVKPLFLLAEELPTKDHCGDIIDVVWAHWDEESEGEFSYVTKFAVQGKIINRSYHTNEEMELFCDRLALPERDNLEKMVLHRTIKQNIEEVKSKRNLLASATEKDFEALPDILKEGEEVFLFKKGHGEWSDPFYDITIESPYQVVEVIDSTLSQQTYTLKHPKTGEIRKHLIESEFYAYIVGSRADIAGLQLKDESYKKTIESLKDEERKTLASIQWLSLKDSRIQAIQKKLPRHPFDYYFKYVNKGEERQFEVPAKFLKALELIIEKHMPDLLSPLGVHYIPIDNLLYMFHEVIPRAEALIALEVCDIVHEPAALLLGFDGKRELPPKFLVSSNHIVYAYMKFPHFIETCERYLNEDNTNPKN